MCEKERDDDRLAVEGLDGVDEVQVKERPGERAAVVWRWRCKRRGEGGKVGQGVHRSTGAPFLFLVQCRTVSLLLGMERAVVLLG